MDRRQTTGRFSSEFSLQAAALAQQARALTRTWICQPVAFFEDVAQKPLVFFMKLHVSRKQIDRPWVIVLVCNTSCVTHFPDHDEEVFIGFRDHVSHRLSLG